MEKSNDGIIYSEASTLSEPNIQEFDNRKLSRTELSRLLYEVSLLLDTGLNQKTLEICVELISNGVNPESLANAILLLQARKQKI
ncbi:mitotic-spindle organizing gamma-tubulin ring associated-domain-containing protein [Lipomyces japonicus]|uniref:mitotic-spindle organizing gamma-tubulin ring associated-domain-containing protein n=1 Tax=Lipomyces japonicus TaxID=56871 RepID=UPI0034CE4626